MEEQERSRSPSRAKRVEQAVGRWLRRSRDSISRERKSADGWPVGASGSAPQSTPVRVTVQILRDPLLESHGFSVSEQPPLQVRDVTSGGPADGKLVPGDQLLKINNIATDDLSPEQAAVIISEVPDSVTMTVLRQCLGPKSSFMTAEKRARLRSNPVKVRFAEEVVVNGHAQGNSLLFLPNVLKVYLENGQTKAFKFGTMTTVKDILDTLKEKLSIRCIGYFALVLEQQYTTTRLLLLHEEEIIHKVVQRKDSHDYRCLFRVSFLPCDPLELLQRDPAAFEYLYLQSVSDVLRERFAVEMKCNTALCLAALHMQERVHSCGQTHKTSVKSITKEWGIENFISPTLLRNMKEKDLRKAISYHMKKTQSLMEPRQKVLSVVQARLNYLKQLGDLMSYGGKFFTATMMYQERETMVNLLVGARYGISQVVNHKLNLLSPLMEFNSIGRVELMPESEKTSLVRIYIQDMKPVTLLMEPVAAKDLSCLVSGYCKLEAERAQAIFLLANQPREHRISAEEGYGSRGCSDSDESSEAEAGDDTLDDLPENEPGVTPECEAEKLHNAQGGEDWAEEEEEEVQEEETPEAAAAAGDHAEAKVGGGGGANQRRCEAQLGENLFLELSDFCHTDSRVDASFSSDSMDALMEDAVMPRPSGGTNPQGRQPDLADTPAETGPEAEVVALRPADIDYDKDPSLCFAELSRMVDFLPSPPEASEEEEEQVGSGLPPQRDQMLAYEGSKLQCRFSVRSKASGLLKTQPVHTQRAEEQAPSQNSGPAPVVQPSSVFGDSSSEDEFFDAHDRFTPSVSTVDSASEMLPEDSGVVRTQGLSAGVREEERTSKRRGGQQEADLEPSVKKCHKRQASFPRIDRPMVCEEQVCYYSGKPSDSRLCLSVTSLSGSRVETAPSSPIPSSCSRSAGCYGGRTPSLAHPLSSELAGEERAGVVVEAEMEKPPVASLLSPTMARPPKTESSKVHTADGKENEENHCAASCTKGPASNPMLPSTAASLLTNQQPRKGAMTDIGLGTTKVPLAEGQGAGQLEGSPRPRSTLLTHRPEEARGGHSLSQSISPQPALPSLCPLLPMPKTPSPKTDTKSNQEVNEQAAPPPFRLEHRKRNSCFALLLRNGVSPSYENLLRSEMEALGVKDTRAIGRSSASVKESSGLDIQGCSSALGSRLSSSMIRCKIQKLPWYLSRSQEPHSTRGNGNPDDSHNSSGSSDLSQCRTEVMKVVDQDSKFAEKATEIGNHSEEQVDLRSDTSLSESGLCVKTDDSVVVSSSVDMKPETRVQADTSVGCQGPTSQFGVEEESNPGVNGSIARTVETCNPKQTCSALQQCESEQPHPLPQPWHHPCPSRSASPGCGSASGLAEKQAHREACGCRTVYANCFSGDVDGSGFDEELTVHEFSRRTQAVEGAPMTSPLPSSFSSNSFPSFPAGTLSHSATSELSPLLPSLETRNGLPATPPEDALTQLRTRRYRLPGGFASLQRDVEELLALLQGAPWDRGQQPDQATREPLFSDSGQLLHAEARRLMSGCQQVTRVGQTPEEMLQCLADGFRALVRLACSCLRSPGGVGSRDQALGALREIAGAYGEFARAAERVSGRESCQDLSIKLLARQCTALTTSIFCLTQLFCTITTL
ncbi:FERM and PDZ domain-containing protein 1-like [Conger conger]|uniref:FERM and PDZ domain-containing protein 1-like n=1 Tax=Conger conger TaxID=82655 RepID=UPI002A5ABD80|nr:FERM and PDZ domain-containing protein 1-like [Conger conger]XP_061109017.1 FERM and PDZ domain-containing protein 1-like [Conger conger]